MRLFSKPHIDFALAVIGYVLRGRLFNPGGHRPIPGHVVPDDFVGVGVAASDDPAVDDYIIERLNEGGIRKVRLDFTYGDSERPASRLLARLCEESFKVMLHLVQPFESASRMADQREQTIWRSFIADTLDKYGDRVDVVEIGSTINRKRWAGYSLSDFLTMWGIAHQEVRSRGLRLAGPSVTDFEPLFNIGILSLLKKRGQLPDIHTDNLFSERCTEPERFDHKVFGRRLASVAKVNLVKKALILQKIGAYFGVPKLLSPAAFWTLPRIERMLPDSEQKQADYLSRYMVLCAASGTLEGAWWGPLICHREGLIDDGDTCYPDLERITHYAEVNAELSNLRDRPAFQALRAFVDLIPGCLYEGRLTIEPELEVHAFRSSESIIHIAWTINGRAAALMDLYADSDIQSAEYLSRDGLALAERPSLVSESPLYMRWMSGRDVPVSSGASVLRDVIIHRHVAGKTHYLFREHGWQGMLLAHDQREAGSLLERIHPERIERPKRDRSLRYARNAIWTVDDLRRKGIARLVIKQPVKMHFYKRFFDQFKPSKGLRSWNGTCELLRRGVSAAPPVAWFAKDGDAGLMQNFYVCEYVDAEYSVRQMFSAFSIGTTTYGGKTDSETYRQLSSFLIRLHGVGIYFRDLSGGNILVCRGPMGELEFWLIDTGRIQAQSLPLHMSKRLADLVRVCNKLHWDGRERLLSHYFDAIGRKMSWLHRLAFIRYDIKVYLKRRFGRKAIRRMFVE